MYHEFVTAANLAYKTKGFSNRDLQNLVEEAITPVILVPELPDRSNKIVSSEYFASVIKQIKNDPKRKLEREIGTWKHMLKKNSLDPRAIAFAGLSATAYIAHNAFYLQKRSISIQKDGIEQSQRIADKQAIAQKEIMEQSQRIADNQALAQKDGIKQSQIITDKQTSDARIIKQAVMSSFFNSCNPFLPISRLF